MQEKLHYLKQLALIESLTEIRTPILDFVFRALNFFDSEFFSVLLVSILIMGFKRISGIRLSYLYYISYVVNHSLKHLFALPRPSIMVPSLAMETFYGYGFPSGGAQSAALVFSFFAFQSKNKFRWVFAAIGMIMIGFSRVYIGAHFFSDVIAGLFVGGLIAAAYKSYHVRVEKWWIDLPLLPKLGLILLLSLGILFAFKTNGTIRCSGAFMGMSLGLVGCQKLRLHPKDSTHIKLRMIRILFGMAILGGLFYFTRAFSLGVSSEKVGIAIYFSHLIIGLWLSLGTAWALHNHENLNR